MFPGTVKNVARRMGCPFCSGAQVLKGFNDLATTHPGIAAQAHRWDPSIISRGNKEKREWICEKGHIFSNNANARTNPANENGCPEYAKTGFNKLSDGWLYLMQRPGEQQIGITNIPESRIKTHEEEGWYLLDIFIPVAGQFVLDIETEIKRWLRESFGVLEGKSENWVTTKLEVSSLAELKTRNGLETDLF